MATFELGPRDSAFIIRADLAPEVIIPQDTPTADEDVDSALCIGAIALLYNDEEKWKTLMSEFFERIQSRAAVMEEEMKTKR